MPTAIESKVLGICVLNADLFKLLFLFGEKILPGSSNHVIQFCSILHPDFHLTLNFDNLQNIQRGNRKLRLN